MNCMARLTAIVLLLGAAACQQAPPPAEPAPGDAAAKAPVTSTAKYAAKVPASIWTPDNVETRIGTLKFSDGRPDDETVKKLLDKHGITDDIHLFNEKLREWEDYYNYHRPHGALDGQTPYERLVAKTRAGSSPAS